MERWYDLRPFRNKGSPALISSYRDILLMYDDGKSVQRLVRKKKFTIASKLCVDSSLGEDLMVGKWPLRTCISGCLLTL